MDTEANLRKILSQLKKLVSSSTKSTFLDFATSTRNSKKIWNLVKTSNDKNVDIPLRNGDEYISDDVQKAELFNLGFGKVFLKFKMHCSQAFEITEIEFCDIFYLREVLLALKTVNMK